MTKFCNCRHEESLHTDSQGCLGRACDCQVFQERPLVVCLCGSTRFYDAFLTANYRETMAGKIVLSVGFFVNSAGVHGEGVGVDPGQKMALDQLHKRKIDLADEVLVLNVGGYIGASTASEVQYATRIGKPIRYLEPL
jgi:hypothetical protein